jgi:flagellar basal body-associated protein FliL
VVKKGLRKMLVAFVLICAIFALGFAGGFYFSGMASGIDEENGKKEISRAYPIYELGEFKLSLPGNEFTDPALVSFELVLELEDEKVLKRLNEEEYWRALFRNEVISRKTADPYCGPGLTS